MPQIYLTRGCALANLGKYKEGVIELKKSLQLDPENDIAQKYLERILTKYEEEQKLLYTKQAKQLSFDKQRLEMKNNAALNFNAQENNYKFVSEGDYGQIAPQKQQNLQSDNSQSQKDQTQIGQNKNSQLITSASDINSKRTFQQLSKSEDKSTNNLRSSSSSSSNRKKKKRKDKKSKKEKKEKKDKKKRSKS